jgi:hypothetical protein
MSKGGRFAEVERELVRARGFVRAAETQVKKTERELERVLALGPAPPINVQATSHDRAVRVTWTDQSGGAAWHRIVTRAIDTAPWESRAEVPPGISWGDALGVRTAGQAFGVQALRDGQESTIVEAN